MSQALSEFRSPVGHEALRLRMVAMNGREDSLLDAARFPRLLRQANDAEVADVRKIGDDDYEISAQRGSTRPPAPPREEASPSITDETAVEAGIVPEVGSSGPRENGQRLGVRFRRGSRSPLRPGEVPLIGVVQIEPPSEPEPTPVAAEPEPAGEQVKRPGSRARRPPRKRAATVPEPSDNGEPPPDTATPAPRRPRSRSRKKPE